MLVDVKLYVKYLNVDIVHMKVIFTGMKDHVDGVLRQWQDTRPDLDVSPLAILSRVMLLSKHIEKNRKMVLAPFGLDTWSFDVLASLRRQGEPFSLSPTELRRGSILTSGAMTNRIDRLEERSLVERVPNPHDRRAILVRLTSKGLELIDEAVIARLEGADNLASRLSEHDRDQLTHLLRKLLVAETQASIHT
jgi:DNA-binding MarR family transcriptional regulator